ncbi:hypothetical protein NQ315_009023 [Exocentrus adspersus]|uniref:SSD domain-containing protein n=1 Tax=Exocentrus adspersus TaxID=1586481 RepID=A0AAV8VFP5_9CUCU|nr:hypothetical protein NQ315_009023 [Exocentrus adspersus]
MSLRNDIAKEKPFRSIGKLVTKLEWDYLEQFFKIGNILDVLRPCDSIAHLKDLFGLNSLIYLDNKDDEVDRLSVLRKPSSSYLFLTFSTANVNRLLKEYSRSDIVKLGVVLAVACVYGWVANSTIAALGVLVLASSAAAALGVCSLIGLPMNLLSIHVLPFVSVGVAMREMFMILSSHTRNLSPPEVLQRTGPNIISGTLMNSGAFLAAAVLPIPALRVFCLQCAVMVVFHGTALLIMLPSILALQQRCQKADVPCFRPEAKASSSADNNNVDVQVYTHY